MSKKGRKRQQQRFEVIPGEGKRFSFNTFKQAFVFYLFLIIALAIIIQLGYHWLGEQFLAWQLQVVAAEPGVMQEETVVEGIVTRHEQVMKAPANGLIIQMASPGERVAIGTELLTIGVIPESYLEIPDLSEDIEEEEAADDTAWDQLLKYWQQVFAPENEGNEDLESENKDQNRELIKELLREVEFEDIIVLYSEQPGYLSFFIDGWEHYGSTISFKEIEFVENAQEGLETQEGELVRKGQPVVKLVDNWQWYFSIILPLHPGRLLAEMSQVDIEFSFAPGQVVKAKRDHYLIDEARHEVCLTYKIERVITDFDRNRWTEATLRYDREQGLLVPADALIQRDNINGVFINLGGRVVFQPVTIIKRQGDKVLVEGLTPYSQVISKPDIVQEGQRLN